MKKKIAVIGLFFALTLPAFCACAQGNGAGNDDIAGKTDGTTATEILKKPDDVYAVGAVSTAKLLGTELHAGALKATARAALAQSEIKTQAAKFNEYFTALDSFLGEEVVTTVSTENTDENYPYETKLTISGKDINGDTAEYVMYYTETLIGVKTDGDETESNYSLEGVMVIDGSDYYLFGGRTAEEEEGETENEIRIRAYAAANDELNYVEMKHESSVENDETETEYVYSVYVNGVLTEQTAIEFETEKKANGEETEYELEFLTGGAKGKYSVERETKNGKTRIRVKYFLNGEQGKFYIDEVTDENGEKIYEYSFDDNSKLKF